jgi:hypothetical protein
VRCRCIHFTHNRREGTEERKRTERREIRDEKGLSFHPLDTQQMRERPEGENIIFKALAPLGLLI